MSKINRFRDKKGHLEVVYYVGMKLTALVAFRQFGDDGPNYPIIPD